MEIAHLCICGEDFLKFQSLYKNLVYASTLRIPCDRYFYHQTQAQTMKPFNYEKQWKSVEDLIQKGLNQSAEKEIKAILSNARQEKNTEEYIRALCSYRVSLRDREEESRLIDIKFFMKNSRRPVFRQNKFYTRCWPSYTGVITTSTATRFWI
ncbi:MAG: hypothetical protein HWD58_14440 [Bacteroidota bacterium]|nr:MAG: hypothetical protein HWD58_14440 [Bacteroidota bacterium]